MPLTFAYGKVYSLRRDSWLYALEEKTGELVWKFCGLPPWGNASHPQAGPDMPFLRLALADGKYYSIVVHRKGVGTGPHADRAGCHGLTRFVCLDASTGTLVWDANNWFNAWQHSIADGNLYGYDTMNSKQQFVSDHRYWMGLGAYIYCIGKGPTEFSELSVDQANVKMGETVTISGQLLDMSPGLVGPPPLTPVPAYSPTGELYELRDGSPDYDEVHANAVPVNITFVGSDGVRKQIAYVKTDSEGRFSFEWTPYVEGVVQIRADSVGSDAFYAPENAYVPLVVTSAMDLVPILEAALVAAIVVAVALPVIVYFRMRKPA
jgi:hypothetical protein